MKVQRASGVLCEVIDDRAVLINPAGTEVLTLNRVGTLVWDLLSAPLERNALAAAVGEQFPTIERGRVDHDVEAFVTELLAATLLVETRE